MKNVPFRYKLIISILVMSLVPLLISAIYILNSSKAELEQASFDKLTSVRELKNKSISRYLSTVSAQISTMSHDLMLINASKEFKAAFKSTPASLEGSKAKLNDYYSKEFAVEYKNKTGTDSSLIAVPDSLSQESVVLQHAFISNSTHPLGSKHLLDESPLVPEYSAVHKVYHPIIREFLETFSLYDVFIVDNETGNIIYSVFKELDFATNLLIGPYKDTNLAEVFKLARDVSDKKVFKIVDFKKYLPSYESPASFIASPIWDGDKKIGVLIFQMPLSTINEIMAERSGLGNTGESYLVGEDKKLRSDTFTDKEFNIYNSFNKDKLINSPNIKLALEDKPGAMITKNFNGKDVLSSYTKISYPHLPWVIFAEQSSEESFAAINTLKWKVTAFILVSMLVVIIISMAITKSLSGQIEEVVEAFSSSAHDVQNSSQKMGLISNKLYSSVQTQISSITESAAAMDEISAMLQNNNVSSKRASSLSLNSKSSALKGKETVDKMMVEVRDISSSYDDIQRSVEKNNEDINKIINVINEIAQKTKVINDIVFQTKILSFNASVEAARAGESGKGFAVVAEEIAKLAAMSGTASNDISEMLISSQEQVRQIADETKKHISLIVKAGRSKIENGTNVAQDCMTELDSILSSVYELDVAIQEINVAILEQTNGVTEVNTAMKSLENVTHATTDMSERSKSASQELREQSISLRMSIQVLRKILGAKKNYDFNPESLDQSTTV